MRRIDLVTTPRPLGTPQHTKQLEYCQLKRFPDSVWSKLLSYIRIYKVKQEKEPFLHRVSRFFLATFALIGLKTKQNKKAKHSLLNFGARCAMVWLVFTNGLTLRCGRTRCAQNLDQLGQLMTNATGWSHHRCLDLHCHHLRHHYHPSLSSALESRTNATGWSHHRHCLQSS